MRRHQNWVTKLHGSAGPWDGGPGKGMRSLVEGAFCPTQDNFGQKPTYCSASAHRAGGVFTCHSQSLGCLYLAAKLHAFEHLMQQKPSVRCKPTACCFFSSGPHLLDVQSSARHLSCPQWQEPDLLPMSVGIEPKTSCLYRACSRSALLKQCLYSLRGCARSCITW